MQQTSFKHILISVMVGGIVFVGAASLMSVWILMNGYVERHHQQTLQLGYTEFHRVIKQSAEKLHQQIIELNQQQTFQSALHANDLRRLNSLAQKFSLNKSAEFVVRNQKLDKPLTYRLEVNGDSVFINVTLQSKNKVVVVARDLLSVQLFDSLVTDLKTGLIFQSQENKKIILSTNNISDSSLDSLNGVATTRLWLGNFLYGDTVFIPKLLESSSIPYSDLNIYLVPDLTDSYKTVNYLQKALLIISFIGVIVASWFAFWLSRRVKVSIKGLKGQADKLAQGEYKGSLANSSSISEINDLSLAFYSMQNSVKNREDRINYQANHDLVTGLFNRNFLEQKIMESIEEKSQLQTITIKILGFRTINDVYGYENGDTCLRIVSERILRWPGIAARISDSEIVFMPEQALNDDQLETLKHIVEQPVEAEYLSIPLKVIFVEIRCPQQVSSVAELFRKINISIDEAINRQHGILAFNDDLEARYNRRLAIVVELKKALTTSTHELSMVYQPKIALSSNTISSVEALIRWNNDKLGFVPPDEFIQIAEQAGMIDKVTDWVVHQVLTELAVFRQQGFNFRVAINLSSQDIHRDAFINSFGDVIHQLGLRPDDIEIEITESDIMADFEVAKRNLRILHDSGFNIAIDDFGTGYSSLAYIKAFTVSSLKIDKSFVLHLDKNESDQQIVRTILLLANALGFTVTAEGVETGASLALLNQWGCTNAQGFFLSKPLPAANIIELCQSGQFGIAKCDGGK